MTPYRSDHPAGPYGFVQLLHAEWTKFRTVAGWPAGMLAAALLVVLVALLAGVSSDQKGSPAVPIGPGGEPVTDSFYFVHQPLTENGRITVAVSALRTSIPSGPAALRPGIVDWSKAGLIIKQGARQGSPYAAIMVTGGHGVRMQSNYVSDLAGLPGPVSPKSPRWLRLERAGDAITGYASADGTHWVKVGTVRVTGLGPIARGGLFVASPPAVDGKGTRGSVSTAVFGQLRIQGQQAGSAWTGEQVGAGSPTFAGYPRNSAGSFREADGNVVVTGAGDIAPATRETLPTGGTLGSILTGTFAALIAVIVIGTAYITTEYRQNLIHVTLAATPGRGGVLLAKAIVLGAVSFVAGLAGAAIAIPLGEHLARANGVYVFPVTPANELRMVLGTAALLATASVLALAVATIFRHSAGAVTTVVVAIVLPYLLIANPFMPSAVADWLARVTPAAGFAVHQTLVHYPQVASIYTPYNGYYPLAPWAGLAVLAGYALVGLAAAAFLLRRRDA
ncbi:ABC transporter permease subunit [Kribbella deserti]|uniref:ABC transporter permease subunit n=1 Tax=Kribbella deserti TaxID=1926257 RepID=A0ABV6QHJ3_9ACTN